MEPESKSGPALTATEVVRTAFSLCAREWKRLFIWALFPLPLWLFLQYAALTIDEGTPPPGKLLAQLTIFLLLSYWIWVPFVIRLYRYVIIGVLPDSMYSVELFRKRTWVFIGRGTLVFIQCMLLFFPFVLVPGILFMVTSFRSPPSSHASIAIFSLTLSFLALFASVSLMAMRLVLFGPDVAMGGGSSLARLGRRAAGHRWLMVGTVVLILFAPLLFGALVSLNDQLAWIAWLARNRALALIATVVWLPFHAGLHAAIGLIYKNISQEWPALDAAEEERARRLKEKYPDLKPV